MRRALIDLFVNAVFTGVMVAAVMLLVWLFRTMP